MTIPDPGHSRFRWLLRMYPSAYVERYGPEMEALLAREWTERKGFLSFWLRQVGDHGRAAMAVRRRYREDPGSQGRGPRGEVGMEMLRSVIDEVRTVFKGLTRAPVFTLFAIGTVGLGIGATTTVFTVLDRVVLRPLPYPDADRLVVVGSEFSHDPGGLGPLSPAQLADLIQSPGPAEAVVGVSPLPATITRLGDPERLVVNRVSRGFFQLLGAGMQLGRGLDDGDQLLSSEAVTVLDHAFWLERFGGDPAAIGRSFEVGGVSHRVVGVLDRDFIPPENVAGSGPIWVPGKFVDGGGDSDAFSITALARLPDPEAADAFRDYAGERFGQVHDFLVGAVVTGQREHVIGGIAGRLGLSLAGVALLLIIACVNTASLTLTRAREKEAEVTLRAALGASRARLVRPLITESLLIAALGGALGGALAYAAIGLFRRYAPQGLPRLAEVSPDGWSLGFVAAVSLLTLLLFGLGPAFSAAKRAESGLARADLRGSGSKRDNRVRAGLLFAETALAVVLVVGSGLLAHDLVRLSGEDRGFRAGDAVSVRLNIRERVDGEDERRRFWSELATRAEGLPGVTAAAVTTQLPYDGVSTMVRLRPQGFEGDEAPFVPTISVTPGYFEMLGVGLAEGRYLDAEDVAQGDPVAVVNTAFAEAYWPTESPLGGTIVSGDEMDDDRIDYRVVGVLEDLRTRPGQAAPPQVFIPMDQLPWSHASLVVQGGGAVNLGPALRALIREMAPGLPIGRTAPVDALVAGTLDRPRFYAGLFGGFAAAALLLALVGVYATTAYGTRSRAREIGIRMALGAVRAGVVRGVVVSTGRVLLAGVLLGLTVAALAGRFMADLLSYVDVRDATTYLAVAALVLLTGVWAAWVPARRSSNVDPAQTLREA